MMGVRWDVVDRIGLEQLSIAYITENIIKQ